MLDPCDQKEIPEGQKSETFLSSRIGEGSSCSLETTHDKRRVPRPKLNPVGFWR
jgi:hypothetical protein